jgi:hypothetical protein
VLPLPSKDDSTSANPRPPPHYVCKRQATEKPNQDLHSDACDLPQTAGLVFINFQPRRLSVNTAARRPRRAPRRGAARL